MSGECLILPLQQRSFCFVSFSRSLAVGTKNGYKLYDLKKIDKLDLIYDDSKELFFNENLFGF